MMSRKPNVLILFTDQQRFDAMGCAGNTEIRTPNMDGLAASGVRFTQACTSTPVCVAARMSMATGHRVSRHRFPANNKLPGATPDLPTLMTCLHDAGYWNQAVGKTHFRGRHYGFHGFQSAEEVRHSFLEDDYLIYLRDNKVRTRFPNGHRDILYFQPQTNGIPLEHHKSTWVTQRSIEFLRRHKQYNPTRPFLLFSSWTAPHPPFAPPEPYDQMYPVNQMGLPEFAERPLSTLPASCWGHRSRLDGMHRDPDRLRRVRALYYGLVSQVDDGVGEVLAELQRLGLEEDTIVIFASDHGEMMGDHGLSQKNVPYEHSVRIPLIVRWPGVTRAGATCDDLVGLNDILPTLIHGLGLEYPQATGPLPGESFLRRSGGGLGAERDGFFIDYSHGRNRWVALRTRRHKYVLWASGGREELFDLQSDPWETRNLATGEPELTTSFRERVLAWESGHGFPESLQDGGWVSFDEPDTPAQDPHGVVMNEGKWPDNLPRDMQDDVETYAQAFTRLISKESCLSPEKLSISDFKAKGGDLRGTPWEKAWREA
jgi:arylsulfatase A-like enzyme